MKIECDEKKFTLFFKRNFVRNFTDFLDIINNRFLLINCRNWNFESQNFIVMITDELTGEKFSHINHNQSTHQKGKGDVYLTKPD